MKDRWFVVADAECPGVELSTYEEAAEEVRSLQKKGNKDARIVNPVWERGANILARTTLGVGNVYRGELPRDDKRS